MTFYEQHYLDLIVTFYEWHYLDLIVTFEKKNSSWPFLMWTTMNDTI